MAQMLIRNIPDDVLAAFKDLARAAGVSQEEAARQLIVGEVERHRRHADFAAKARAIQESFRAEGREFDDSTEIIRRMRDGR